MKFEATTTIDAPLHRVFDVVSDFCRDPDWKDSCAGCKLISGDGGSGSRLRYVARVLGRTIVTESTVTVFEPGKRVEFEIEGDRSGRGWRLFEEVDGGTQVTVGVEADLAVYFGPLSSVLATLGRRQADHELETLKVVLEHAEAAA